MEIMHGKITQSKREWTLRQFREGRIRVIVATDVISRGLDIPNVELVVQIEPPGDIENYIHRAGRTARAGSEGVCITFFNRSNKSMKYQIERRAGIRFEEVEIPREEMTSYSNISGS